MIYIPPDLRTAARHIREARQQPLARLSETAFLRAWHSIAYLWPGLHPDEAEYPTALAPFQVESWVRALDGRITDEELYPSDAAWCGLYDRGAGNGNPDSDRRRKLLSAYS